MEAFIPDGSTVAMSLCLEPCTPFAVGHELIRRRRRDLTLVGPISDALFDQLIGAGCVRRVIAAWVGNVSEGLGHCYRRAAERGIPRPLEIVDHSNFSISLALWAAAWNAPYIPTPTLVGSDIVSGHPGMLETHGHVRVAPVRPDVAVVHVQRCDREGRAHLWGPLGLAEEAGLAAAGIVITCEELVDEAVTLSDPNRILFPETKVVAVVHVPGGARPSPVQGYWRREHEAYRHYAARSRTEDGFAAWLEESVFRPQAAAEDGARVAGSRLAAPVDYAGD